MGAWKDKHGIPYGCHGGDRRLRDRQRMWWVRQREAAKRAIKAIKDADTPGTKLWAEAKAKDAVERWKKDYPHWFKGKE